MAIINSSVVVWTHLLIRSPAQVNCRWGNPECQLDEWIYPTILLNWRWLTMAEWSRSLV